MRASPAEGATDGTRAPSARSPYERAIDALAGAISARARRYRNLVVTIVALVPSGIAVSLLTTASGASIAAVLAVVACAAFVVLDVRGVERWRRDVLRSWVAGELDLPAFASAARALPALPPETAAAMIHSLPGTGEPPGTPSSAATRDAAARVSAELDAIERRAAALRGVGVSAAALSVAVALGGTPAAPIGGAAAWLATALGRRLVARRGRRRVEALVATARERDGFDGTRFAATWSGSEREPFRTGDGARLLALLTDPP